MSANPKTRDSYRAWTTDNIRYSDLDPNGHVNNGAMNALLEDGRVRFRQMHLSEVVEDTSPGTFVVRPPTMTFVDDNEVKEVGRVLTKVGRRLSILRPRGH